MSNIFQENPIITFNKLCPAIKLINNRTPKLIGLAIYEINSIGTKSSAKKKLVLAGKNKLKILNLYLLKVIIFKPKKMDNDKIKVTIKWLVAVKLYGIKPIKLLNNIKLNKIETIGKYLSFSNEIMSEISCAVVSETDSKLFCQELGLKKKELSDKSTS